jgi:hypothetical protein
LVGTPYFEKGDAGDSLDSAQFITGGSFDMIVGNFYGTADVADVYAFHWIGKEFVQGGDFRASFSSIVDPTLVLYDFSRNALGSASGDFPELILKDLVAGDYFLELTQSPSSGTADYTVTFTPILNPTTPGPISSPVPEPSTLLLLGAGLASIGLLGRKLRE